MLSTGDHNTDDLLEELSTANHNIDDLLKVETITKLFSSQL